MARNGMDYRLFGKDQTPDDEPEATLRGRIEGADSGDVVITLGKRIFVYADTDGDSYVDFREAQTVFDASSVIERKDTPVGG
jgi:hypothetical protein